MQKADGGGVDGVVGLAAIARYDKVYRAWRATLPEGDAKFLPVVTGYDRQTYTFGHANAGHSHALRVGVGWPVSFLSFPSLPQGFPARRCASFFEQFTASVERGVFDKHHCLLSQVALTTVNHRSVSHYSQAVALTPQQ